MERASARTTPGQRRRPAMPRDAASLVLVRGPAAAPEVLLGRRPMSVRFMPGIFVFPGGKVEPTDHRIFTPYPLRDDVVARLSRRCTPARARALAWTAIRETWEETGVLLGRPIPDGEVPKKPSTCPAGQAFVSARLAPDLAAMDYIARAITPTRSPIRFNTRFFLAEGESLCPPLPVSRELEDIGWWPITTALNNLRLADVTVFVLAEAARFWRTKPAPSHNRPVPLRTYSSASHRVEPERS